MTDDALDGFDTYDVEFVFERGVGMTVYVHRAEPWLSWDETKRLAVWLNDQIKKSEEAAV